MQYTVFCTRVNEWFTQTIGPTVAVTTEGMDELSCLLK
jgi:hypothetical protein